MKVDIEKIEALMECHEIAMLETGAKVEIPPFMELGDVVKVDTRAGEFIQRV